MQTEHPTSQPLIQFKIVPPPSTSPEIVDCVSVLIKDAKRRVLVVVLVRVPEDVDLVEGGAGDGAPVRLGVLDRSDGVAVVCAGVRPARLRDPDPLARADVVDGGAGGGDCVPEGRRGGADGRALEVGVGVYADEVRGFDDGCVGRVDPVLVLIWDAWKRKEMR